MCPAAGRLCDRFVSLAASDNECTATAGRLQSAPACCVLCWVQGAALEAQPCQLLPFRLLLWKRLLWVLLLPSALLPCPAHTIKRNSSRQAGPNCTRWQCSTRSRGLQTVNIPLPWVLESFLAHNRCCSPPAGRCTRCRSPCWPVGTSPAANVHNDLRSGPLRH